MLTYLKGNITVHLRERERERERGGGGGERERETEKERRVCGHTKRKKSPRWIIY